MCETNDLPAGKFSTWFKEILQSETGKNGMDVPCGSCTACCKSSYFIHVRPEEKETIAHIPKNRLFPAPGLPKGHMVLGYNQDGHCPMLVDDKCSIYVHRPQTCRNYDCRVFAAAGIIPDEKDKALIHKQSSRWKFSYPHPEDEKLQSALKRTAAFLLTHASDFPKGFLPSNRTQLAGLAVKVSAVFLDMDEKSGKKRQEKSVSEIVDAIIEKVKTS